MSEVMDAYSRRAAEYIDLLGSVDAAHPSDRRLIESWAAAVTGRVLDAGCGPGHWTHHLRRAGVAAHGVDLVPDFIDHARSRYPGIGFDVGSIDCLDEPDGSLGGILSWYSTIHHAPSRIASPISEFARTLRPGGTLLLGYFDGPSVDAFDHAVAPAYRWPAQQLQTTLERHGFSVLETHRRTGQGHRPHGALLCRRAGQGSPGSAG